MNIQHYPLADESIQERYSSDMRLGDYSLTFTLNPKMYSADIVTQYRKGLNEFIKSKVLFEKRRGKKKIEIDAYTVHPDFEEMWLVPELTADYNIHFHGYFRCNPEMAHYFKDSFKSLCYNNDVLGRQWEFHEITTLDKELTHYLPGIKDPVDSIVYCTIKDYAFKEIDKRTKKCRGSEKLYISYFGKNNLVL